MKLSASRVAVRRSSLALLGALCLSGASAQVVKLAVMVPLTGSLSAVGLEVQRGAELAAKLREREFRALGITLQVVPLDDRGEALYGVKQLESVLPDAQVLGLVGAMSSGVTLKVGEANAKAAQPLAMVSPNSATTNLSQKGWAFFNRVVAVNAGQANVAVEYMTRLPNIKTVFVVSDNQTYGNDLSAAVQLALPGKKIQVVGFAGFSDASGRTQAVEQIRASKPDLIFYGGTHEDGAALLKAVRAAAIKAPFMGGAGLDTPDFIRQAGEAAANVMFVSGYGPVTAFTNGTTFATKFQQEYKTAPAARSIYAFDAMNVFLDALKTQRESLGQIPTRRQMIQAVRTTTLSAEEGIAGPVAFTRDGDRINSPIFMMQIDSKLLAPKVVGVKRFIVPR